MAFSYSGAASGGIGFGGSSSSGAATVRDGPELQEIQTDKLGFAAINGAAQLRVVPKPWPSDALPPPSASLLAVASRKGLLAAADPDGVYLASTQSVRAAFQENTESEADAIRPFSPQMSIPYPRPAHVSFSADESILVVSAQEQGGIDAFQLSKLAEGQETPALRISTNGQGLRALIPNPAFESARLFAAITNNGELLMADLNRGGLQDGKDGSVLKSGVTCCSWSNKGKQLVAGGADGTVTQMKPDGSVVSEIPKPTSIPAGCHVSGISWLENDSFLIIYTPTSTETGPVKTSEYSIVTREPKTTNFTFQKLPEVVSPFGLERVPPFHFIARMRSFPPHIQDMLVLSASCSTDLAIITKADQSLASDGSAVGDFTLTTIGDDSRRAQLPVSQDISDTTPIGMALDLSSNEKVPNPIPSDVELLETPGPVPGIMVLTNEGHLLLWWVIYNDSVRQNTIFSGLGGVNSASSDAGVSPPPTASSAEPEQTSAPPSTFGQSSFSSAFSKPSLSTFGSANSQSAFGGSSDSVFGKTSTIGGSKVSWASTGFGSNTLSQAGGSGFGQPSFGQPSFGSATPMGGTPAPTFGSASLPGSQASGFGQTAGGPSSSFGKPGFGSTSGFPITSASSPFGAATPKPESSGFAAFSGGGFGGKEDEGAPSPFAKASGENVFGKPSQDSPFGSKSDGRAFGGSVVTGSKSPLGDGTRFKLDSSFKRDNSANDDLPKPSHVPEFGLSSLEDTLGEQPTITSPTHDKEEEMEDEHGEPSSEDEENNRRPFQNVSQETEKQHPQTLITPPSTLSHPKTTPAQPVSSLFGTSDQQSTTPLPPSTTIGWSFGPLPSTTPEDTPAQMSSTTPKETPAPPRESLFGSESQSGKEPVAKKDETSIGSFSFKSSDENTSRADAPRIKEESPSDDEATNLKDIPEAPLPPDTMSKPRYASGDTSVSSLNSKATDSPQDDAPLPPDFLPAIRSAMKPPENAALPIDGDEGEVTGEDTQEEGTEEADGEGADEDSGSSEISSDFEGVDEHDEDVSPIDEPTEDQFGQVQTSPESSSKSGVKSPETSPTGGLFTKVTSTASQKPVRPLFGEVGTTGPIFAPPKPQESPRSPSPIRNLLPPNLRSDSSRSVSAPAHPRSVIDKRKEEHAKSQMALEAAQAREDELAKQKANRAEEARLREQKEAEELQRLEDNEDERLREELQGPIQPTAELEDFVTYQPRAPEEGSKSGVPAQIERLYQDINSMVYTLGINARSLSAYMDYQRHQEQNQAWPSVLNSETPLDALNDEQVLDDILRLHEGNVVLEELVEDAQINDAAGKLQYCHNMISQDLLGLRNKLVSVRKTLTMKSTTDKTLSAPLSADQASIQQDLRKSSALAQSKLVQIEDSLLVLRAKLTELSPQETGNRRQSMFGASDGRKKPTVEAVSNTIAKMTAMAEKKSADIDVLEAQLRKLEVTGSTANGNVATPNGSPSTSRSTRTPASGKSSVYHTPNSKFGGSVRSTSGTRPTSNIGAMVVSDEDKERWQMKARRKKEMASILVDVLAERRKKS